MDDKFPQCIYNGPPHKNIKKLHPKLPSCWRRAAQKSCVESRNFHVERSLSICWWKDERLKQMVKKQKTKSWDEFSTRNITKYDIWEKKLIKFKRPSLSSQNLPSGWRSLMVHLHDSVYCFNNLGVEFYWKFWFHGMASTRWPLQRYTTSRSIHKWSSLGGPDLHVDGQRNILLHGNYKHFLAKKMPGPPFSAQPPWIMGDFILPISSQQECHPRPWRKTAL